MCRASDSNFRGGENILSVVFKVGGIFIWRWHTTVAETSSEYTVAAVEFGCNELG